MIDKQNMAWHFIRRDGDGTLRLRDDRVVEVGEWLVHDDPVKICESGLHASRRALDALNFVEWDHAVACRVEVEEVVTEQNDKLVCRRRRIMSAADCDEILMSFARWCAVQVLHLWNAPPVVREYLETGRKDLRAAAWTTAMDATAAWTTARATARDAAMITARATARDAAWATARATARDAARSSARSVARSVAGSVAGSSARAAARAASWTGQNAVLEGLLLAEMKWNLQPNEDQEVRR